MTQMHSDVMYRLLVEGVVDYAIYMLTPEGVVSNWNAGAQRAKGYAREEIVGQHFSRFYSDEERANGVPDRNLTTARTEGRFEAEGWRTRKDGTQFWAHVVIDAINDDDGQLIGFAKITRDCTEQRQLRLEKEAHERRFRQLVEGVTDYAIYILDTEGNVASWNAGAERAKGYTQAEILGRHFSCFYSAQDQAAGLPQKGLAIARDTGQFKAEGWRYRKDGSRFWTTVLIDAIHDEANEIVGYAKITRDISERREQEQQLLKAKELAEQYSEQMKSLSMFLDTVVSNIPSSVIVKDAVSRKILLANRQAERLFGGSSADMVGKRPQDCLPGSVSDYFDQLADEALRAEGVHRHEEQLETANGLRALRTSTLIVHGNDPRSRYVMLIADDVTDENAAHAKIHFMAHHDILTGLPNRRMFRQRLNEALQSSGSGQTTAVLCLDLDNFKTVNDTLGHQFGDELLRSLTTRLRKALRDSDTLSRLGGDEFAVVLPNMGHPQDIERASKRLIDAVRPEFSIEGHTVSVGMSIGIALAPQDHTTADTLLRYADLALYEAKRNGRNQFSFFTPDMAEAARKRRLIEMDLRDAIMARQLHLHYQPIIDRAGQGVIGYEALMRWQHPTNGMIMPMDFIPIAEETGLIHEVGAFALHEACAEAMRWGTSQSVAVNLSPVQFKNSAFVSLIQSALTQSRLPPDRLELEITESVLLENSEANIETLRKIKALGVKIALDDFGTGYSSLSYLRSFPFDKIKIDKSFTRDVETSREALAIIRAINGIGRSLEIPTTAEGVETSDQLSQLQVEGCSHFQGYYFGRPLPASERLQ